MVSKIKIYKKIDIFHQLNRGFILISIGVIKIRKDFNAKEKPTFFRILFLGYQELEENIQPLLLDYKEKFLIDRWIWP